jgi:hypothetical protein
VRVLGITAGLGGGVWRRRGETTVQSEWKEKGDRQLAGGRHTRTHTKKGKGYE